MMQKSILVDIDETIKGLMEQLNQDFVSDIRSEISSSVGKSNNDFMLQLDELKQKNASEFETIRELSRKGSRDIEEAIDIILGIEDIIKGIDGLDKVASSISEFSSSMELIKSRLFDMLKSQSDEIMNLSVDMKECHSSITNSIENAHRETFHKSEIIAETLKTFKEENVIFQETLGKDLSKINSTIDETGVTLKSTLHDAIVKLTTVMETKFSDVSDRQTSLQKALDEINPSISKLGTLMEHKLNSHNEQLNQKFAEAHSRLDSIDNSINKLEQDIERSADSIKTEINSKLEELSSGIDKIISKLSEINSESINRHKETGNMLDRIIYLTTPFWNRKKLSKNEN